MTPDEATARYEVLAAQMDELNRRADVLARMCATVLATYAPDSVAKARKAADDRDAIISRIDALRIESNRL